MFEHVGTCYILLGSLSEQQNVDDFSKIMRIDLNATGNFHNMMSFIETMEKNERIVEIDYLNIQGGLDLTFSITMSIWGVR